MKKCCSNCNHLLVKYDGYECGLWKSVASVTHPNDQKCHKVNISIAQREMRNEKLKSLGI
jgi:hypothetical protein